METKIDYLDLSVRCYYILKNNNITDIKILSAMTETDFDNLKGVGKRTKKEVVEAMELYGIKFKTF